MPYLTVEKENGVAVIWLDQPGEKVNKLAPGMLDEFEAVLTDIENDSTIKAAVLISRKPDNFIAGADIDFLFSANKPGEVEALSSRGHELLNRIEDSKKPVVAAINGAALGGGLEVALACHYRIATDSPKTVLGLPEVNLGVLPAGGGTYRLPKRIELQRALDMMLTGKNIYPYPAKKMGLIDHIIHPYALLDAAKQAALKLAQKPLKRRKKANLISKIIESMPLTRRIVYKKAREMVDKKTLGNYPAPYKILECIETGIEKGKKTGLSLEANSFENLAHTPQAKELLNLFKGITALKKNPLEDKTRKINKIGVLGAGFMGAGIANISAAKGIETLLKDVDYAAIARGQKGIWKDFERKVKRRAISGFQRDQILSRISGVIDYKAFGSVDVVIEAVFEDLELKQKILAETEAATKDDCIFASNTSSLPITSIAKNSKRPGQVIGMHYFSPVPKMPLLEIIVTDKTEDWATATAIDIGIRQGKTVIVVKDGPGFYTTRILSPMLNEALLLLEEGGEIRQIDRTMRQFGFPVGPITLIDEVGIDVGAHVTEILGMLFAARGAKASDAMKKMAEEGYKGRKNKKGFYHYHDDLKGWRKLGKKKKEVNQTAYKFFGGPRRRKLDEIDIQTRLSMVLINEAAHCLADSILQEPRDGDLGAVLGIGFPPFLGGPFRYIDRLGAKTVLAKLDELENKHGKRFTPAQIIRDYAGREKKFYEK